MGTLDILQSPDGSPESILANEQLLYLLSKGLDGQNIQDGALTAALTDPSAPAAPTGLTLTGSGTYQDPQQGLTRAFVTLSWINSPNNFGDAAVLYRQSGQSAWLLATRTVGTTARVEGLETGLQYDFGVQGISQFNIVGAVATLLTQLMPGDTTVPASSGTPTIIDKKLTTISFNWSPSTSKDLREYGWEVRTGAAGAGTLVSSGTVNATALTLDVASAGYGASRYFRVRAIDLTNNMSGWSADVAFSFAPAVNTDIGSEAVQTGNVAVQAITTTRRQLLNSQTQSQSIPANAVVLYTFNHNLGVIPVGSAGCDALDNVSLWGIEHDLVFTKIRVKNLAGVAQTVIVGIQYF